MADELSPSESVAVPRSQILTGPLRSTIFLLALPVLCEQMLNYGVDLTDTWLSGRISKEATSAIGVAGYVGWLASMIFGLVGTGTTALVSRAWGAGDYVLANRVMNRSLTLAGCVGGMFCGLIFFAAPGVAHLLNLNEEAAAIAVHYVRVDGVGNIFTSISFVGAAALRGAGDMRSPMIVLGLVNVLNAGVSILLVFGLGPIPPIGVKGIVYGTFIARVTGGILMLLVLHRGLNGLRISLKQWRIRGQTVKRILSIGGPAALEGMVTWGGHFLFLMVISQLAEGERGHAIFAAHVVGIMVEAITYLPAVAWGMASATMIGQSLGADDKERAFQVGNEATWQCGILGTVIGLAFFFGADLIYHLMHEDPLVHEVGIPAFKLLAFFELPLVISIVYVFSLRGAGDTVYPLFFAAIGVIGVRVPMAYFFGIVLDGGLIGAWIGMGTDITLRAILVTIRYRRGRWLATRV